MLAGPVVKVAPLGLAELHESKDSFGTSSVSCWFVVKLNTTETNKLL